MVCQSGFAPKASGETGFAPNASEEIGFAPKAQDETGFSSAVQPQRRNSYETGASNFTGRFAPPVTMPNGTSNTKAGLPLQEFICCLSVPLVIMLVVAASR